MNGMGMFGGQDVGSIQPTFAPSYGQQSTMQQMGQGLQTLGQSGLSGTSMIPMIMALRNAGFQRQNGVPMQQMPASVSTATPMPVNQ